MSGATLINLETLFSSNMGLRSYFRLDGASEATKITIKLFHGLAMDCA